MIHTGTVLHSAVYILPRIVDTDDTALFVVSFVRGLISRLLIYSRSTFNLDPPLYTDRTEN